MKLEQIEKQEILKRLEALNYNRTQTARSLGIGIRTLQRKLARYEMQGVSTRPSQIGRPSSDNSGSPAMLMN